MAFGTIHYYAYVPGYWKLDFKPQQRPQAALDAPQSERPWRTPPPEIGRKADYWTFDYSSRQDTF